MAPSGISIKRALTSTVPFVWKCGSGLALAIGPEFGLQALMNAAANSRALQQTARKWRLHNRKSHITVDRHSAHGVGALGEAGRLCLVQCGSQPGPKSARTTASICSGLVCNSGQRIIAMTVSFTRPRSSTLRVKSTYLASGEAQAP